MGEIKKKRARGRHASRALFLYFAHLFLAPATQAKVTDEFYQRWWAKRGPFFSCSELIESARAFEFAASAVMNS